MHSALYHDARGGSNAAIHQKGFQLNSSLYRMQRVVCIVKFYHDEKDKKMNSRISSNTRIKRGWKVESRKRYSSTSTPCIWRNPCTIELGILPITFEKLCRIMWPRIYVKYGTATSFPRFPNLFHVSFVLVEERREKRTKRIETKKRWYCWTILRSGEFLLVVVLTSLSSTI